MRKDEFETDWIAQAFASKGKEKFDPVHQALKEVFSFRVNFVNKTIECLFMPLNKVNESLKCLVWVLCSIILSVFCAQAPLVAIQKGHVCDDRSRDGVQVAARLPLSASKGPSRAADERRNTSTTPYLQSYGSIDIKTLQRNQRGQAMSRSYARSRCGGEDYDVCTLPHHGVPL